MSTRFLQRTPAADDDLMAIWRYIAGESPHAADHVLDQLDARSHLLLEYPEAGRSRPDIAVGVRCLPVGNYLILYRVTETSVDIVRYVHGARLLADLI